MNAFQMRGGRLMAENVALTEIAERFGTPTWVYSRSAISAAWNEFAQGAANRRVMICYALKANSTLAIVELLARLGAGFDIVSGGELERVLAVGGDPSRIVFSGVGKSHAEIERALEVGVRCFNVESQSELRRLDALAGKAQRRAPVSLRVNPDVDAGTHPYISTGLRRNKFGIAHEDVIDAYRLATSMPNLDVQGIDCHIGSQITSIAPFLAAVDKVLELVDRLADQGITLAHIDLGGGLGIRYDDETPPGRTALLQAVFDRLDRHPRGKALEVMFEFGRSVVGNAGVLLTRVEYLKRNGEHRFAIVDAAMNDLTRPAMYEAWHAVRPVEEHADGDPGRTRARWDIVGPVCESGDWLARARELALAEGDLLALMSAGAYGSVMSSNYNTRARGAEVLVDGTQAHLVRERERIEDLFALEKRLPPDL